MTLHLPCSLLLAGSTRRSAPRALRPRGSLLTAAVLILLGAVLLTGLTGLPSLWETALHQACSVWG